MSTELTIRQPEMYGTQDRWPDIGQGLSALPTQNQGVALAPKFLPLDVKENTVSK